MSASACDRVPDPGHGEVGRELGDLHHLRSVGELLKDPEPQRELLFGVGVGFALLELKDGARAREGVQAQKRRSKTRCSERGESAT